MKDRQPPQIGSSEANTSETREASLPPPAPERNYINIRRYMVYLEHSLSTGIEWVVFEPNREELWARVRSTLEDFLRNQWMAGALLGDRPEEAYFVHCDRTTMTQNDLDNGRLVCVIGVAPVKPAEFVVFRISHQTANRAI